MSWQSAMEWKAYRLAFPDRPLDEQLETIKVVLSHSEDYDCYECHSGFEKTTYLSVYVMGSTQDVFEGPDANWNEWHYRPGRHNTWGTVYGEAVLGCYGWDHKKLVKKGHQDVPLAVQSYSCDNLTRFWDDLMKDEDDLDKDPVSIPRGDYP